MEGEIACLETFPLFLQDCLVPCEGKKKRRNKCDILIDMRGKKNAKFWIYKGQKVN